MSWLDNIFGIDSDTETADKIIKDGIDQEIQSKTDIFMRMHEQQQAEQAAQTSQLPQQAPNFQSRIEFVVDLGGNVDINVMWPHDSPDTSKNLGLLLHAINNGDLEQNCADLMIKILQEHPNKKSFIQNVMDNWREKREEEPLMKPSDVFGFNSQGVMDSETQH